MSSAATASKPRLSASVIVVNAQNEILLVQRNPKASSFAGMHVFPGGNFDERQDKTLRMTAIRETFEESGLLLATCQLPNTSLPSLSILDEARVNVHQQRLTFSDFLDQNNLIPDVEVLLPFTQWITPVEVPRRFQTQFFVLFLSTGQSSGFSSGAKQHLIPKDDGGQEVIAARFIHPKAALDECRERKITLMPPQFYLLTTLVDILTGRINTPQQRSIVQSLSRGAFGSSVFNPRTHSRTPEGRWTLTYEGDETRGGSKGRQHRMTGRGICNDLILIRNFDIRDEIEPTVSIPTKL